MYTYVLSRCSPIMSPHLFDVEGTRPLGDRKEILALASAVLSTVRLTAPPPRGADTPPDWLDETVFVVVSLATVTEGPRHCRREWGEEALGKETAQPVSENDLLMLPSENDLLIPVVEFLMPADDTLVVEEF